MEPPRANPFLRTGALILAATLASAGPAAGQTYTVLHPFRASVRITSSLVEAAPEEFYGTTDRGGAWSQGSVVKVTAAGVATTLHSFSSNVDGESPLAGLVYDAAGGLLYGTTTSGGANGRGTIFRIKPDGTSFETVYHFLAGTDPSSPEAALIKGSDGKLYGTSRLGGTNGLGTVFALDLSTTPATLTTLWSFAGGPTEGAGPVASLLESAGFLYGTTAEGGLSSLGTVFKFDPSVPSMPWFASFDGTNGAGPRGGVVEKGGEFFGTAGAVFKVTSAGALSKIYDIPASSPNGGLTLGTDGFLYGTSPDGGANSKGSVFKIDPSASPVSHATVHSFAGADGEAPKAAVMRGSDGKLYGTTRDGGTAGYGTSYQVDPAALPAAVFSVFYEDPGDGGAGPFSPLYRDGGGVLYGTASVGGIRVGGAIYKLDCATPPCALTTLRATQDLGMGQDFSGVVPGPGGFLYGTAKDSNSLYRIRPDGSGFETLYTFTGTPGNFPNGSFPVGVTERGGILYGATASGGTSDKGTLFALDPTSPSSLAWSTPFSGTDGRNPSSQLVAGSDAKLYGVTNVGGVSDKGTLFRVTTGGTHELLHSFSGPDGSGPWAALTPAEPGIFFGTTQWDGTGGKGTFFRLDATTTPVTVTTLRQFAADEVESVSVLTRGSDGNFYGTSTLRGANGLGSVVQLAPSGALRILHSFSGPDGAYPRGGVLRLGNGTLLGTTEMAGPNGGGVVFELNPATSTATAAVSGGGVTTCAGGNVTLTATLTGTPPWTLTWSDGLWQSVSASPATRTATPSASTTYTLTTFSDAFGEGVVSGSAAITVSGVAPSTVVTAPASAAPSATGLVASVPDAGAGAAYAWTVANGLLTSGQGTRSIVFSAGSGGFTVLSVTVTTGPTCSAPGSASVAVGNAAANSITFTRLAGTTGGAGAIDANGNASRFNQPTAVAFDGAGTLYVADGANTIRRISTSGDVTTLAGLAGNRGSADGTGGSARFWNPRGLALDGAGNLYVSDHYNHTIRKVTPAGVVTTYLGLAGSFGNAGGTGSAARLHYPAGLAVDLARNVLYVAERGSHVVRRVDLATGEIFPYAGLAGSPGNLPGTGSAARFFGPLGLAIDGAGTLYVADASNYAIRKIARAGMPAGSEGNVTTLASGFVFPDGMASDGLGNLWVADSGDRTIQKVSMGTGAVAVVAGRSRSQGTEDGTGNAARFFRPTGVAADAAGNAWVSDGEGPSVSTSVRKVTAAGVVTTVYGAPAAFGTSDGTGSAARFNWLRDVASDGAGNVYVADTNNHTIRKVDASGLVVTFAGLAGSPGADDGPGSAARFWLPMGVATDVAGNVYVSDTQNHTVRKITSGGSVSTLAGSPGNAGSDDGQGASARFNFPRGLAVDAWGNVYVADWSNSTIRRISPTGFVSTLAGLAGSSGHNDATGSAARFTSPVGLAVDAGGNVFVADSGNCTIRKIGPGGAVTTLAGQPPVPGPTNCGFADGTGSAARFYLPTGIALDASGDLFVTELNGGRLRRVTQAGVVTTLVGNPTSTAGSDDGTDDAARFWEPMGLAVLPSGNLVVADTVNSALRIGRPALAVAATIDSATGSVGVVRQLGTSAAASTYAWEVIRRPSGSTAALSSASARAPAFTPDVADLYVFRLTASSGPTNTSITLVSLVATSSGGCTPPPTPVITAPSIVGADSPNRTASVVNHAGSTYAWSVTNGTITAGQGTSTITFRSGSPGSMTLSVVETNSGCSSAQATANVTVATAGQALLFYPLYPCRLFQTGSPVPAPPIVGPPLAVGETRTIPVAAGQCGIPPTAKALALNATVIAPAATGHLVLWPAGQPAPGTSNLNFVLGRSRANNAIVSMPGTAASGFSILNASAGGTGLILDVSGYFE